MLEAFKKEATEQIAVLSNLHHKAVKINTSDLIDVYKALKGMVEVVEGKDEEIKELKAYKQTIKQAVKTRIVYKQR